MYYDDSRQVVQDYGIFEPEVRPRAFRPEDRDTGSHDRAPSPIPRTHEETQQRIDAKKLSEDASRVSAEPNKSFRDPIQARELRRRLGARAIYTTTPLEARQSRGGRQG
jgi:hypothetical protein